MPLRTNISQLIKIGAGKMHISAVGGNEYDYVGDTEQLSINVATEVVDVFGNDNATANRLATAEVKTEFSGSVVMQSITYDNLAKFFRGTTSTVTQTATPVVDEAIASVTQGKTYYLGATLANSGVRGMSSVVITDDVPSAAFTVDVDYEIDLARGSLYIIPGGAITTGTNLLCDYTPDATSRSQMVTDGQTSTLVAIRYESDNTVGDNDDFFIPSAKLIANGDFAMKSRSDPQKLSFDIKVEELAGSPGLLEVNGISA